MLTVIGDLSSFCKRQEMSPQKLGSEKWGHEAGSCAASLSNSCQTVLM